MTTLARHGGDLIVTFPSGTTRTVTGKPSWRPYAVINPGMHTVVGTYVDPDRAAAVAAEHNGREVVVVPR